MNDHHTRQRAIVIEPPRGLPFVDLRELVRYRELLGFLALRDIQVRYKQTAIGVLWVLLQPLLLVVVFAVVFGRFAGVQSAVGGLPYAVFALAGLLPWQYFSRVLSDSGNSLVTNQRLISRIYFPRLIVPLATALVALLDLAIGLVAMAVVMAIYGVIPGPEILALPVVTLLLVVASLGVGFWLAALNTEYRDVMYAMPFLVQLWMFATPVVYPATLFPERFQWLLGLNPVAGIVEGYRWCLLGTPLPHGLFWTSAIVTVALFVSGVAWFRYRERVFIDSLGG